MKYALITATAAALVAGGGCASAQGMTERTQASIAATDGRTALQEPAIRSMAERVKPAPAVQAPETTASLSQSVGRPPNRGAAVDAAAQEDPELESRRVRAAVGRTFERMQGMFRTASP